MFFDADIKGNRLPPKSVCLTYDDGPGHETQALGHYLFEQGIKATFFVVGRHAEGQGPLLAQLRQWGHRIGNHTYGHPGLVRCVQSGQDALEELAKTDALIRPHVIGDRTFLRAPYGNWREKPEPSGPERKTSLVAETLNSSRRFPNYVGPINWDISAADYDFWRDGRSAEECCEAYLRRMMQIGRGMILMHDSSEDEAPRLSNQAFKTTRLLLPELLARGFRFLPLEEIPQVRSALRVSRQMYLRCITGRYLQRFPDTDEIIEEIADEIEHDAFGVVRLAKGRIALRASHGLFLSAPLAQGLARANASCAGPSETFAVEQLENGQVRLRAWNGTYLAVDRSDGRLYARRGGHKNQRFWQS
jgi:peptidoglycan/xylan/chitin deacetylase (PgdA/CDA1 family)